MDSGMKIVDFGDDVLEQILGRLPDVSLPFVTMVCKRFRSLICSPSFHYARTYLRVVGLPCIVIVSLPDYHMACIPSEACPSSFLPQLSLFPDSKFKGEDLSMCTSAAGLFYYFLKGSSHPYSHVLFNPVTGEIQHTPSPYSVLYFLHEVGALGLAVEPSASPVLVACVGNPCRFIFTYSFPSSTWRHARVELCLCDAIINNTVAAYCNGALHWLHGSWYSRGGIIAFNVASNFAYRLSLPEGVKVADFRPPNVWLGAIGGRLVAVLIENADVVVWAMEDYGENAWWKKNVLKSVETIEEVQRRLQITKVAPLFYGEGRCLAYAWDGKRRDARMLLVYSEETRIWSCIRRVSGHQLKLLRFIPATMVLSDFRRMSFKLQ
ncbi:F-box protein [Apostasia shenzhenica]|uniref:F-box protein n=1 Tax=Apostasia shenzhenica TaxID=1088818 RepID=A0A2I0BDY3_9ASPA|nr:F-box protein [Apostasia shenzhenica]